MLHHLRVLVATEFITLPSPDHSGDVLEGVLGVGDGDPLVLQRHPRHARVLPVLGPHVDQGAVPGSMAAVSTLLLINTS